MQVMIDSGALLALVDRRDQHHTAAAQFVRDQHAISYVVLETIFVETMTLVKARVGGQPAITLGERLMRRSSSKSVRSASYDLLLVVADDTTPKRRRSRLAYQALRGTATAVDVLVWPRQMF